MIVSLAGQKGGSGKTTTAICLADEWHRRGSRVLVIDTDPQATARTWGDVASELGVDGPTIIGMGAGFHEKLGPLTETYDVIVIDCPPGQVETQRAALMTSDVVIVPCGAGATDVWSMAETVDIARQARMLRPSLYVGILITRRDSRTVIGGQVRETLEETGLPVFEATLGRRVDFEEAPNSGTGVTRYNPKGAAAKEIEALADEIEDLFEVPMLEVV